MDVVAANAARLSIRTLDHPQLSLDRLDVRVQPATGDTVPRLVFRASELRLETLGEAVRDVEFDCELIDACAAAAMTVVPPAPVEPGVVQALPAPESAVWQCEGPLRWRGGGRDWTLAWQSDEALTQASIRLTQGRSRIELDLPLGGKALAVEVRRMPAPWLRPLLPQVGWQDGRIDGRVELSDAAGGGSRWRGELRARSLSAEAAGGSVALAGMDIGGPIDVTSLANGDLRIASTPTLASGELLAGSVYVEWPADSTVALDISAAVTGEDWRFDRIGIGDAGFEVEATARLRPAQVDWLQALDAKLSVDLSARYARYLEGAMASIGQAGLDAEGSLTAALSLGVGGQVEAIDGTLTDVALAHPDGRYAIAGIDGNVAFRRAGDTAVPIDLRWRSLRLHALDFGGSTLSAETRDGEIRALQPLALGLFGGAISARDLVYRPLEDDGIRLQGSAEVSGIDLGRLTTAFDWPAFAGRLDGSVPQLRYVGDELSFGGEIAIQVFDGQVRIARLAIERPFGIAPALAGEVTLADLDLIPMTEVFGLGRIEGRLNGQIAGLRLLDWQPTAFDARLETAPTGRRRISQLAVEQLTQIGGGGAAAGIQGRLLGVFDSFGYRRIGLSCRLANQVCQMGGVDESAGGYTILQGSGLPLITIRGFQTRVDWPVLVQRLKAVAGGQRPVVN